MTDATIPGPSEGRHRKIYDLPAEIYGRVVERLENGESAWSVANWLIDDEHVSEKEITRHGLGIAVNRFKNEKVPLLDIADNVHPQMSRRIRKRLAKEVNVFDNLNRFVVMQEERLEMIMEVEEMRQSPSKEFTDSANVYQRTLKDFIEAGIKLGVIEELRQSMRGGVQGIEQDLEGEVDFDSTRVVLDAETNVSTSIVNGIKSAMAQIGRVPIDGVATDVSSTET